MVVTPVFRVPARAVPQAAVEHAVLRRDEVRHWVLTDATVGEILWALSRYWADNPLPDGLRALRDALTDYVDRRQTRGAAAEQPED